MTNKEPVTIENTTPLDEVLEVHRNDPAKVRYIETAEENFKKYINTEWPEDETRIDNIGTNGNDGEHYSDIKSQMLIDYVTDADIVAWCTETPSFSVYRGGETEEEPYSLLYLSALTGVVGPMEGIDFRDCVSKVIVKARLELIEKE